MERWELKQLQGLDLEMKIIKTKQRIKEWYEYYNGEVYVSFSGGKDSTVLLTLARELYPDIVAVFCDTGLEFPQIRAFIKTFNNVVTLHPEMGFREVIEKHGYPVISKMVSRHVSDLQNNPSEFTQHRILDGIKLDGSKAHSAGVLAKKWRRLITAPFKISHKCCGIMKKKPLHKYGKESGQVPMTATMACESPNRQASYLKSGCNSFNHGMSVPMAFWTEQDVLKYLKDYQIPYCSVYGDIVEIDGKLRTTAEQRTGCMFCMFSIQYDDKEENRFQRMQRTHPKIYKYCMETLGIKGVMEYLGFPYAAKSCLEMQQNETEKEK